MLTAQQLRTVMPRLPEPSADEYLPHILKMFEAEDISSPRLIAGALATMAVESAELTKWEEDLRYSAKRIIQVFGSPRTPASRRVTPAEARTLAGRPEALANRVYIDRFGNGPRGCGDGWRFRGRGPTGLTWRLNYRDAGASLDLPLEEIPDLVATPAAGFPVFGWYWRARGLAKYATAGDVEGLTRKVQGGVEGLARRRAYFDATIKALGA